MSPFFPGAFQAALSTDLEKPETPLPPVPVSASPEPAPEPAAKVAVLSGLLEINMIQFWGLTGNYRVFIRFLGIYWGLI